MDFVNLPPLPSSLGGLGTGSMPDFSQSGIDGSSALSGALPSLPALPSLDGAPAADTSTGTGAPANGSTPSNASTAGCSFIDIKCWGSAFLGRIGIVVLGLIMLAIALWMMADKPIPVPIPV